MKKAIVAGFLLLSFIWACSSDTSGTEGDIPKEAQMNSETQFFMNKGQEVVSKLGTTLLSRLNHRYEQTQSVPRTVSYCKVVAYNLVDTMGSSLALEARRVSQKVRNLKDEPTDAERDILRQYESDNRNDRPTEPMIKEIDPNTIAYYQPITMGAFCLKCHGKVGEDISEEDYAYIKSEYPNDRAVGYEVGDLRGMWSVKFRKDLYQPGQ